METVGWAMEVFVVDSHSVDRTVELARKYTDNIVQFDYAETQLKKKNWALETLPFSCEWVLFLDADERVPEDLCDEIASVVSANDNDGYYINRRLIFLNRWIKHGGWYPSWNLRLFKHRRGRFETMPFVDDSGLDVEVHEHVVLDGTAGYLTKDLIHYDLRDLTDFVNRLNRYSTWDAHFHRIGSRFEGRSVVHPSLFGGPVARKRMLKRVWTRLPFKPVLRFVWMYVFRLGFLDGRIGLYFCSFMAVYEFLIAAKKFEHELTSRPLRSR